MTITRDDYLKAVEQTHQPYNVHSRKEAQALLDAWNTVEGYRVEQVMNWLPASTPSDELKDFADYIFQHQDAHYVAHVAQSIAESILKDIPCTKTKTSPIAPPRASRSR